MRGLTEKEADFGLFRLPLPDKTQSDCKEIPALSQKGSWPRREQVKTHFWKRFERYRTKHTTNRIIAPPNQWEEWPVSAILKIKEPSLISEDRVYELLHPESVLNPDNWNNIQRPAYVDSAVTECTPQFSLRNIPRIERVVWFELMDWKYEQLLTDPFEEINKVHTFEKEDIEWLNSWALEDIKENLRIREELFGLVPWEKITRRDKGY